MRPLDANWRPWRHLDAQSMRCALLGHDFQPFSAGALGIPVGDICTRCNSPKDLDYTLTQLGKAGL